ncbi:MAG TPA: GIY-YIG nuclease family protein, partial [Stellaceae bacterium]|nr:GIY-YIG nuclease family protein [Stellaceae bacterium]
VRPSRRPLRDLLRMRTLLNGIPIPPHPEERAERASRRTHDGYSSTLIGESPMPAQLYILRCNDGSYYVGTTRGELEVRLSQHNTAQFDGYTARRRPVTLVYQQEFDRIEDAIAAERQVKSWRREKKEALIRGEFSALPDLAKRHRAFASSDRE